ncbi:MAG TPA: DUF1707 domain-containing protein [Acidimicrobiales bacterium]|nr:DUF1707 domain-containing protein [Acidimicrobiales bacterium]
MSADGTDRTLPRPVPELATGSAVPGAAVPGVPPPVVTDEERNRYGVLLDHAAERGLLSAAEYRSRLAELADAVSVDELRRIVTELPAFGGPAGRAVPPGPDPAAVDAALWANLTPAAERRGPGNGWVALALLVAVLVVAMVALALIVSHVAHNRHAGAAGTVAVAVSRPRP